MAYHKARLVWEKLIYAYYEERNVETLLSCVTENIEWVGTEKNEWARGKIELQKLLVDDFMTVPHAFHVEFEEPQVQQLTSDVVIITGVGKQYIEVKSSKFFPIRGTLCCVKKEAGWLISNVHFSVPNTEYEIASLLNDLNEERVKQKALLANVPGGIAMYRLKKDGRIPADYVSDGLAKICGYEDGEDIMKVMGYDSRKLVYPEDYPIVAAACKASLEQGIPTSVQYRIFSKNGNLIRITLDSVIIKNAQLGDEDVAVFYAVQALVSEEATRQMEEHQVLLSLLNTVPAGIGIFEANEDGFFQSYMNDAFYHLIGARRQDRTQYNGKNVLSSSHPKDLEKIKGELKQLLEGKDSTQFDYRVRGGNGNWVWLHIVASVVERKQGRVKLHAAYYECTEKKQQEIQLFQNQRAVSLAEQQGRISIWTYNIDQRMIIQQIKPDSLGHMGYPRKILNVPQSFMDEGNIHPEDCEKVINAYKRLEEGEEKVDETYRLLDQNTREYDWVHVFYQRMENEEEDNRMAVGFSLQVNEQQDAIERYKTEQKLREQMYANATVYMEYNLTQRRIEGKNHIEERYPSKMWESMNKEEYREKMKAVVDEHYLDEVVDKLYVDSLLQSFKNGENKISCEYRSKEREGFPSTWYRIIYTMVKRPDTGDIMVFVCVENIEEEKDQQIAIESSTSDGIEIISVIRIADGQARVVRSNYVSAPGGLGEYYVYNEEFVRRSHEGAVIEDRKFSYHAALLPEVIKELGKNEIYQYSINTERKNGPRKRQLFRFRYLDDRKTHIILSVSDITAVYLDEQRRNKRLEAALIEANVANKAKTNFLSRVSHDMRTPLNGILGLTTLLKDSITDKEALQDLDELELSGKYLLNLINDTLDMNRIESGKLELHPIVYEGRTMFNTVIRMGRVSISGRKITFNVHTENPPFTLLYVDVSRVEQVFMNVFGNAVKFTPDGGTIDFTMKNISVEKNVITNKLIISDTGIGMSPEFLPHIFEPFSQEDASKTSTSQGTGLGMAITKQLIELMGGSISVESELGKGSTFTLILKLQMASAEQIEEWKKTQTVSSQRVKLEGKRILLVEDNPLNTQIATRLLGTKGILVEHAENGEVSLQKFEQSLLGYYDAILMDIRMPVMDGLEATRRIRHLNRIDAQSTPIIAMTANAFADDVEQTKEAGMNGHLSKPIQTEILFRTLEEEIQKHTVENGENR